MLVTFDKEKDQEAQDKATKDGAIKVTGGDKKYNGENYIFKSKSNS